MTDRPTVASRHRQYEAHEPIWQRIRDVLGGADAVKERGTTYLPKPGGMENEEYRAFKLRTPFESAGARTVQGLLGLIFRKPLQATVPDSIRGHLANISLTGMPLDAYAKMATEEVLNTGRAGGIVDFAAAERRRPYLRTYTAESIRNWRTLIDESGVPHVDQVILEDMVEVPEEFGATERVELVVLGLTDGAYTITRYRRSAENEHEWVQVEQTMPTLRGRPLPFIPFVFFGPTDLTPAIEPSPILSVVNLNIDHYRVSADLSHALHMVALPTPWVADQHGQNSNRVYRIGSGTAWLLSANGKAGMLEVQGPGLAALRAEKEHLEARMASAGARVLEGRRSGGVEAAETLKIRQSGESSVLANLSNSMSLGLSALMRIHAWWAGATDDPEDPKISVQLNTDFFDEKMSGQDLVQFVAAWQQGAFPWEVLMHNLRQGEIIPDNMSDDTVRAMLDKEIQQRDEVMPAIPQLAPPAPVPVEIDDAA